MNKSERCPHFVAEVEGKDVHVILCCDKMRMTALSVLGASDAELTEHRLMRCMSANWQLCPYRMMLHGCDALLADVVKAVINACALGAPLRLYEDIPDD